jgi:hypothetical protein
MINNVNTNTAMLWHNVNGQNKPQAKNSAFPTSTSAPIQLHGEALVSAGVRVPGGGMMSASVFKGENFSAQNPVMLVRGTDVDGSPFEVEVNINNVDPRNASFIEMFALDGYFAANGKPASATRAAAGAMAIQDALASNNAFTKFDFVTPLLEHLETQRFHRNWEAVAWLSPIMDNLMNHITQR